MLGGFWAVSLTDTLQGLMMALTAIVLPIAACVKVGGPVELLSALEGVNQDGYASLTRELPTAAALGMVCGFLSIGLGYPGQPHVVNRFMALRDDAAVIAARRYAMVWAVVVYAGMLIVGLAGRVLVERLGDEEQVFFRLTTDLFPPVLAGVMAAAVLSAIMSTADSQLLVAASSISHDLAPRRGGVLANPRVAVLALSAAAILVALFASKEIFDNVLFAWTAMGAAFGPVLLVTLWQGPRSVGTTLAAMLTGFVGSVAIYLLEDLLGGDQSARIVPYVAAYAIAIGGSRSDREPSGQLR
jgi:sodium/proline symporter